MFNHVDHVEQVGALKANSLPIIYMFYLFCMVNYDEDD